MKKINLRGISEILSERELKNVVGGVGFDTLAESPERELAPGEGGGSGCSLGGGSGINVCSGTCPKKFVWDNATMTGSYQNQTCTTLFTNSLGFMCECM
jgi:hypothetical protein